MGRGRNQTKGKTLAAVLRAKSPPRGFFVIHILSHTFGDKITASFLTLQGGGRKQLRMKRRNPEALLEKIILASDGRKNEKDQKEKRTEKKKANSGKKLNWSLRGGGPFCASIGVFPPT